MISSSQYGRGGWFHGYSFVCQPVDYSLDEMAVRVSFDFLQYAPPLFLSQKMPHPLEPNRQFLLFENKKKEIKLNILQNCLVLQTSNNKTRQASVWSSETTYPPPPLPGLRSGSIPYFLCKKKKFFFLPGKLVVFFLPFFGNRTFNLIAFGAWIKGRIKPNLALQKLIDNN